MPTLGLALIARDEEEALPRCLESVRGIFDEIVVVDTGSRDRTKEIAASHGAKVFDFTWVDDFSAARNFSFSKSTTDYVMWLDADDILMSEHRDRLLALKRSLGSFDAYLMQYDYSQDEFGNSRCMLWRHRIVRTRQLPRWIHPIHECLEIPSGWRISKTSVVVTHRRSAKAEERDRGRNLAILGMAVAKNPSNPRMKFYLGKELFHAGRFAEAISVLEDFLKNPDWEEHPTIALHTIALSHHALGHDEKSIDACLRGIRHDARWAEFFVLMGEIQYAKGAWGRAIPWYEIASRMKPPPVLSPLAPDNYTWLPHDRLCKCYAETGRMRDAYEENEIALRHRAQDPRLLYNREYLRDRLFGRLEERPFRLSLGGGSKPIPSYQNCDLYPGRGVRFVFDQCALPYHDGTLHAIYSEHALEHAPDHESARAAIAEWARALRHGGYLELKVPDLELCASAFIAAEDRPRKEGERWTEKEWYRYTLYGIQKSQGDEPDAAQHHRTGFTKEELRRLLEGNGFRVDYLGNYDGFGTPSIEARAVQLRQPIKVRWLVRGRGEDEPSTRIRRLNVSRWLSKNGVDSAISGPYADGSSDVGALVTELRRADVVVFTQFSSVDRELMDRLNRCGVATVFDLNEDLEGFAGLRECLETAREVVFCSTALAERYGMGLKCIVIPDAYETESKSG